MENAHKVTLLLHTFMSLTALAASFVIAMAILIRLRNHIIRSNQRKHNPLVGRHGTTRHHTTTRDRTRQYATSQVIRGGCRSEDHLWHGRVSTNWLICAWHNTTRQHAARHDTISHHTTRQLTISRVRRDCRGEGCSLYGPWSRLDKTVEIWNKLGF